MTANADITLTTIHPNNAEGPAQPTVFQEVSALGCFLFDDVGLLLAFVDDLARLPAVSAGRLERRLAARLHLLRLMGRTGRLTAVEAALLELIPGFTWTDTMTSSENLHAQTALDEEIAQMAADLTERAEDCTDDHEHATL